MDSTPSDKLGSEMIAMPSGHMQLVTSERLLTWILYDEIIYYRKPNASGFDYTQRWRNGIDNE